MHRAGKSQLSRVFVVGVVICGLTGIANSQFRIDRKKELRSGGKVRDDRLEMNAVLTGAASAGYAYLGDVMFHFRSTPTPKAIPTTVEILDRNGDSKWLHTFAASSREEAWTWILPPAGTLRITTANRANAVTVIRDKILVDEKTTRPQGITKHIPPGDKREPISDSSERIQKLGRSVARLRWKGDDDSIWACTGFLISSTLLMTNKHCMQSEAELKMTSVDFGYDDENSGYVSYHIERRECCNDSLDIAVYSLDREVAGVEPLSWAPDPVTLKPDQAFLLIQHPGGTAKKVSRIDCRLASSNTEGPTKNYRDFSHYCDSSGGSSGSPVLDFESGMVVGIHHNGFEGESDTLLNQAIRLIDVRQALNKSGNPQIIAIPAAKAQQEGPE